MTALSPMLATLGDPSDIDESDGWAFEMKWDGIRAIAEVTGRRVRFTTRNGNDVTRTYPDLGGLASQVAGEAVLDGEIVALGARGRPDFGRLQQRMKLTRPDEIERAARQVPVFFMVFDVLAVAGASTTDLPYVERRALLAKTVTQGDRIQIPPAFDGSLEDAVASSLELGLEGVMAKRLDSTYRVGRRSPAWVKVKHHRTQEVVVGGWRPGNGRREQTVGSLLVGLPSPRGLRYIGRVGTGFADRDLIDLAERLAKLGRSTTPFVDVPHADARDAHWVSPTLVGEVEFAEWTAGDRLRQPSWRGWRPDKSPGEVARES